MNVIASIKQFIGLESVEEKLQRFEEIRKAFTESDAKIDELAKNFFIEKANYKARMSEPDNYTIQNKIQEKYDSFIAIHKASIRKAKKQYDSLKKEKEKLEKDEEIKKSILRVETAQENKKKSAYKTIKKAYQDYKISLDSFNAIIKGITKDEKTKYADFILFNENGELLLLKRSAWEDDNVGAWVIPGGHVDPGEDFEQAAIRELREESGYNVTEVQNVGSYEDDKCHIEYFQAYINTKEQSVLLDVFETRDYKWIPLKEVCEQPMVFNMRENLIKILGLQENPNSKTVIRKAILEGLIPIDKIEKAHGKKDITKLVKRKKLITRDGKTFLTTVYVNHEGVEVKEEVIREVYSLPIIEKLISGIKVGDSFFVRTPKVRGEFILQHIFVSSAGDTFLEVLEDGKPKTITTKALLELTVIDGATKEEILSEIPSLSELPNRVRILGGSSGVELKSTKDGKLFAVKKPHKGDINQLIQEKAVSDIYNAMGFKTSNSKVDTVAEVLISEYIDGAKELGSVTVTLELREEIQKGFVLDCLLGNWDVLGAGSDNILVKSGEVYRIDNGGCFKTRAKGGTKSFTDDVPEIKTMREHSPGKEIFGNITDAQIKQQVSELIVKEPLLKSKLGALDIDIQISISKRINWLKSEYLKESVSPPKAKKAEGPELRPDMPSLITQKYFDEEWHKVDINGNPGIKEHIRNHIIEIEKNQADAYKRYAAAEGISVDEYKSNLQKWVKVIVDRSKGFIVAHSGAKNGDTIIGKILSEGRFKTQFETSTSYGSMSPDYRSSTENGYFGFVSSAQKDKKNRPIYGYFTDVENGIINSDKKIPPPRKVSQYGDVCFQVKENKFRKDATITFHDSLGFENISAATPAIAPHFTSIKINERSYKGIKDLHDNHVKGSSDGYGYVESQYHGQLKLEDIEKIHVSIEEYEDRKDLTFVINEINSTTLKSGKLVPINIF